MVVHGAMFRLIIRAIDLPVQHHGLRQARLDLTGRGWGGVTDAHAERAERSRWKADHLCHLLRLVAQRADIDRGQPERLRRDQAFWAANAASIAATRKVS